MANDLWNGNGNWTGTPANWSSGTAPGSTQSAEIQTGSATLSTSSVVIALSIDSGSSLALGNSASLKTTGFLVNAGAFNVTGNSDSVSIGSVFVNSGSAYFGSAGLAGSTTVTAGNFANTGTVTLQGNASSGTTRQMTLHFTGVMSSTLQGTVKVQGDADLELTTGMTTIGNGATLVIAGKQARVSTGAATTSTGLSRLSLNAGAADFEGDNGVGAGGASLTTTTGFINAGALQVDQYGGDGATTLTFGGVLTNVGSTLIGNSALGANAGPGTKTTVTATGLSNSGSLTLQGNVTSGTTNQATLDITAATGAATTGFLRIGGDADLELISKITSVASGTTLELDGAQARASIGAATTSTALTGLSLNAGTLSLRGNSGYGAGGAAVTTTTALTNEGTLWVDQYGGDGGSKLAIGGALVNHVTTLIGNGSLTASTTVTATGLSNSGSLTLQGNVTSGTTNQATLDITAATGAATTGFLRIGGDADLELISKITSVASGTTLELDGAQARASIGAATTSTALTGLSLNAGTLSLRGNSGYGAGGAAVTTTTALTNEGTLWVDQYGGDGGSKLAIGGALVNHVTTLIGNGSLTASTTVTATGLSNSGSLTLQGNVTSGTTNQATLDITAATGAATTGFLRIGGDADLELISKITSVASGTTLELDGAQARASIGAATTSTALTGLSLNAGTLSLRGNSGYGAGGAAVTTTTALTNEGTLWVDQYGGDGGSKLAIGGALVNHVTTLIGNGSLTASTTVTATGLSNSGSLTLQGNVTSGTTNQATLDITAATGAATTGFLRIGGDADLELISKITSVASGTTLELDGAQARASIGAATTSTALTGLSLNAGTLSLRGNSGYGAGGAAVTTTTALTNEGTLWVDQYGGDGGSKLAIGGALVNHVTTLIGNGSLTASTTVTATGLSNSGSLTLQGNVTSGTTNQATLDITAATGAATTGFLRIGGDADLELISKITSVASGTTLELDGAQARASIGAATTSTALTGLSLNAGTLSLRGNSGYGAGGAAVTTTTALTNEGTLWVDQYGGDGGSKLAIGGALVNYGAAVIGNGSLSDSTTLTATGLANYGSITLQGDTSHLAELLLSGTATNDGALTIGASTELGVTASGSFTQDAGTTTVAGTLAGATINANGGLLDFTSALTAGDGTGALHIGAAGVLEFGSGVDSSHVVTFRASSGTLELGSAASFKGEIAGFSGSDVIDLLGTNATGFSYSGSSTSGSLTLTGSSGTIATLAFTGSHSTSSFSLVSDGHGGTDIV